MSLTITHETMDGRIALVKVTGPLNSATSHELEDYVARVLPGGTDVILDGTAVDFISSAGLGMLLILNRRVSATGGAFILSGFSEENRELLKILGFDRVLAAAPGREEALEQLSRKRTQVPEPPQESKSPVAAANDIPPAPAAKESFIVECSFCKSLVRVKGEGDYICPDCSHIFKVGPPS